MTQIFDPFWEPKKEPKRSQNGPGDPQDGDRERGGEPMEGGRGEVPSPLSLEEGKVF